MLLDKISNMLLAQKVRGQHRHTNSINKSASRRAIEIKWCITRLDFQKVKGEHCHTYSIINKSASLRTIEIKWCIIGLDCQFIRRKFCMNSEDYFWNTLYKHGVIYFFLDQGEI